MTLINLIEFGSIQTHIIYFELIIFLLKYVLLATYLTKGVNLLTKLEMHQ